MFDPKSTEAFRQIKAPEDLKERVLRKSHQKALRFSTQWSRWVAAVAVVVFLAVGLFSSPSVSVTVGGLTVDEQAVPLTVATASAPKQMIRSAEPLSQEVVFDRTVTIVSADGLLSDRDALPLTLPCTIKADTPVWWHAQPPLKTFVLIAEAKGKTIQLCLTYEEPENVWTIRRMKAE